MNLLMSLFNQPPAVSPEIPLHPQSFFGRKNPSHLSSMLSIGYSEIRAGF
jgi:hypothetical protein